MENIRQFFKEGEIVEEHVRKKYPYAKKEDQIKRANHFLTFGLYGFFISLFYALSGYPALRGKKPQDLPESLPWL